MKKGDEYDESCCVPSRNLQDKDTSGLATQMEKSGACETVSFPIEGMSCLACARRIEEALSGRPGVIQAVVDFARREASVRFDPARIKPNTLKNAVEETGYMVPEKRVSGAFTRRGPYLFGTAAALGVVGFYLGLLTLTSDWQNAQLEFREYGLWILALAMGLGVQVTLFSLFRGWHGGGSMKAAKCNLATSGGMSTAAMAACCSHYLTVVLPALGLPFLSTVAAGLASYQVYFFLAGVLLNLFGIGFMLRLMIRSGMILTGALVKNTTLTWPEHVRQ